MADDVVDFHGLEASKLAQKIATEMPMFRTLRSPIAGTIPAVARQEFPARTNCWPPANLTALNSRVEAMDMHRNRLTIEMHTQDRQSSRDRECGYWEPLTSDIISPSATPDESTPGRSAPGSLPERISRELSRQFRR